MQRQTDGVVDTALVCNGWVPGSILALGLNFLFFFTKKFSKYLRRAVGCLRITAFIRNTFSRSHTHSYYIIVLPHLPRAMPHPSLEGVAMRGDRLVAMLVSFIVRITYCFGLNGKAKACRHS